MCEEVKISVWVFSFLTLLGVPATLATRFSLSYIRSIGGKSNPIAAVSGPALEETADADVAGNSRTHYA
jgi:hypothetical protein